MGRLLVRATLDEYNAATACTTDSAGAFPKYMGVWFRASASVFATLMLSSRVSGQNNRYHLEIDNNNHVTYLARKAGTIGQTATSTTFSNNVWNFGLSIEVGIASRFCRVNNGGEQEETTSVSPTAFTETFVGGNDAAGNFPGDMAWAFVLEGTTLSESELAALAAGINPMRFANRGMLHCWPLWGKHDPEIDLISGGFTLTDVIGSSIAKSDGPPVELWTPARFVSYPTIPAGTGGQSTTLTPVTAVFSIPQVSTDQSTTLTPVVAAYSIPQVTDVQIVTLTPVVATYSIPQIAHSQARTETLTPVTAAYSIPQVSTDQTTTLEPVTAAYSIPQVSSDQSTTLTPVVATFGIPQVTDVQIVELTPVVATFSIPQVSHSLGLNTTLTPVTAAFSIPQVSTDQTTTLTPVVATFSIPQIEGVLSGGLITTTLEPVVATFSIPAVVVEVWLNPGVKRLYERDRMGTPMQFEVNMRASSGTIIARVVDVLAPGVNVEVNGSRLSTAATSNERLRSGFLALQDEHEYKAQFGYVDAGAGVVDSADLMAVG